MSGPFTILVVCLGNVCRSPLAGRVLGMRFDELLGPDADLVRVSSAGVRALVGHPMDESSAAELRRLGGDPTGFAATQITSDLVETADLVLTATRELRSRVLEDAPRALKRTFTVRELAALTAPVVLAERRSAGMADLVAHAAAWRGSAQVDDYDVPDPIGRSARVHREVADLLDEACTSIAKALVSARLHANPGDAAR